MLCWILTDKSQQQLFWRICLKNITISLDAMGGDRAPEIVVDGASEAKVRYPEIKFIFFGNKNILLPMIKKKII